MGNISLSFHIYKVELKVNAFYSLRIKLLCVVGKFVNKIKILEFPKSKKIILWQMYSLAQLNFR